MSPFRKVCPLQRLKGIGNSLTPTLVDAFQDIGCENSDILEHRRGPGPHVCGCWVVDLLLGKGSIAPELYT
ncbi:MAG TPA: hypothetical protein VKE74_06635 [Gemmataceae bacterium]|nr:hypothetical protein [Gemmataceae bacterium]